MLVWIRVAMVDTEVVGLWKYVESRIEIWMWGVRGLSKMTPGCVQWVMPVISAFWEAKVGGSLEPRSLRPAWATMRHYLQKIKKLTKHDGACLWSQLIGKWKWEDLLSPWSLRLIRMGRNLKMVIISNSRGDREELENQTLLVIW